MTSHAFKISLVSVVSISSAANNMLIHKTSGCLRAIHATVEGDYVKNDDVILVLVGVT